MKVTEEQAFTIGSSLGIDFSKISLATFVKGMNVELEHGSNNPLTNVTNDSLVMTGKIALAHLLEFPDYYERLSVMEEEASNSWQNYTDQDKYNMIMQDTSTTSALGDQDYITEYSLIGVTIMYFLSLFI